MKIDYALSNSFGFGGTNGCLIFKRYQSRPAVARMRTSMKIVVAIKQVPARDSPLRIDPSGNWIDEDDLSFEINEPDAYALEEALQLKEKHGGEVIALCAGPARAAQTIREALAKGADRAIHIEDENLAAFDPLGDRAAAGRGAVKAEKPDLILTGLQSDDLGYGQTGVILAELLGLPHATIIMQVEKQDGADPGEARTGRRLVPAHRDAAARRADHSDRHQQAALRHADGHQESQDQRDQAASPPASWACAAAADRRSSSASTCRSEPSRRRSSTASPKEAAAQAGGKTEIRGAGHMSDPGGTGTARRRVEPHVVGDAGGRRSRSRGELGQPVVGGGRRAGNRRAGAGTGGKKLDEGLRRRARPARATTRPTATPRRCEQLIAASASRRWCCSRTPTRSATSRPSSRRAWTAC